MNHIKSHIKTTKSNKLKILKVNFLVVQGRSYGQYHIEMTQKVKLMPTKMTIYVFTLTRGR